MLSFYLSMLETEGERSKFQEVYEKNYTVLRDLALGMTRDPHRAEEFVHDAFVKLINHKEKLMTESERVVRGFLFLVLRRSILDYLRRQKRITFVPLDDDHAPMSDSDAERSEEDIIVVLDVEQALKSLHEINPLYVDVLVLKYIHDLDIKSIADALNISQGAVKMRLKRAQLALNTIIREDNP